MDEFISYSLSVQNRRKSRAGLSLEENAAELFNRAGLRFSRTPMTEARKKPDFLFPGIEEYRDGNFPTDYLTMLGAKTSSKDRWRQILSEADHIKKKHLLTLELAISHYQIDEMENGNLHLVIPLNIHHTYKEEQRKRLLTLKSFMEEVKNKQNLSNTL